MSLLNLVAEALDQASGNDEFLGLAAGFVRGHFEDGVDRFLLRAFDEGAGIDDDDVGVFGAAGEFGSGAREQAHHDFAVDEVLGAAEADEADSSAGARAAASRAAILLSRDLARVLT